MRKTKIRKIRKSKTRKSRNLRGGAAAVVEEPQYRSCPLLDDLLEDILEEMEEVNKRDRNELVTSGYFLSEMRLTAIAKISELDDGSPEVANKIFVINYLRDQQAKLAAQRSQPNLLIQQQDIDDKIEQMEEREDDSYEFLEVYGTKEIKDIINQFVQVNKIH